ncbi:YOP1 [Candida theae]|uniref:Protein YOP1 n=1 Tax=Candida theae TaxID=1198502 RepID=A0AAD5BJA5_9ASCO|nr:YOP1 [Candida theae]KAI5968040.1 YOP1 [Candida theae]
MAGIPDQLKAVLSEVDKNTKSIGILNQFQAQTGLPRSYAVLGAFGLYFILIFLNIGGVGQLLSNIAGFVVPGYYSILALQTTTSKDDTQLLTYWVVFAFFNVIEFWSKAILYWVPFYYLFKTVFLLYIGIPSFGGANVVYNVVIKPIADKYVRPVHESDVASKINEHAEGVSTSVHI